MSFLIHLKHIALNIDRIHGLKYPEPFYSISLYNPFYYIIDGFRNSFLNTDSNILVYGIYYLIVLYFSCEPNCEAQLWTINHEKAVG